MRLDAYYERLQDAVSARQLPSNVSSLLHGAANAVTTTYSLQKRRREGIFLSIPSLASELASDLRPRLTMASPVLDPAMGCGDLLLACAVHLPRQRTLAKTVKTWSDAMWGFDTNADLISIGKARLALLARTFHPTSSGLDASEINDLFEKFFTEDFLVSDLSTLPAGMSIIANPPFTVRAVPPSSNTRRGTASAAAVFLEKICRESPERSQISALLPEVLRCGSSYHRLRSEIKQYVDVRQERSLLRRDCWSDVDVDVFIGRYSRVTEKQVFAPKPTTRNRRCPHHGTRLDEIADLRVGPIIPYRTPRSGPWRRYVTARSVPAWAPRFAPQQSRRYDGPCATPPFLIVRRTSRPDRTYRAVASVIVGSVPVAVENHLIVVTPKDGLLSTCHNLLRALKNDAVNKQLDEIMRCRHLTITSLASVQVEI
jgi:hypothetical protein